jgi:cyclomaltodextrinase
MKHYKLSRRKFLHVSGMAVASTFIVSSTQVDRLLNSSLGSAGAIMLNGGNADVWAWQKMISGSLTDLNCDAVAIHVNQNQVKAEVKNGKFSAIVPISEGENEISASCDTADNEAVRSKSLIYTGRLRGVPLSVISISTAEDHIMLDGSNSQPSEKSGSPLAIFMWTARPDNPVPVNMVESEEIAGKPLEEEVQAKRLVLESPTIDGEYYISLEVTDEAGRSDKSTTYFTCVDGKLILDDWATENTDWIENAVIYGVIPRNFGSAGFDSIVERLDSLKDLGIDALWLAPVNQSPPGDYGYAVMDYFELDRRYGDKDKFRRMIQEAHKRGIRVLMDFVPNHSSEKHPYFVDAVSNGQASPYWNFYGRDADGFYTYYFDWKHLPNLNYENSEVRRWMLEAFSYWVREFDIDGFRVDVAWGIRERRPDFWPEWRAALKRIKPDVLLLAEASAREEFYFTNGFDAAYDWTSQLGHWAWELVFEDENLLTHNLNMALTNLRSGFHPDALIFRFLNNNDTGQRFITKHGLELTRVATALLLTLPGIPCIYTGDEIGEAFQPYSNPAPLTWKEQYEGLRDYHKQLIGLRHQLPSLHSRFWTPVNVEPHKQVYGYLRHLSDHSQPILVLLNFFDEPAKTQIYLPEGFEAFGEATSFEELLTGNSIDTFAIIIPPYSAMILRPVS